MPDYDIMVDTALSWDGVFPPPDTEKDYEVEIGTVDGDRLVLVSSRYTEAQDEADAASIALDAVCERYGYETDDDDKPVAVEIDGERGIPAWVVEVRRPEASEDEEEEDES